MKQRRFAPFTRAGSIVAGALTLATLLASCAGGSSAASGGSSNDAGASGPVHIKVWAWYPEFKGVVDAFNASHKDFQVDWSNVGTGPDQYAKLKTAFKAGSGAPDVAMVEFQEIPSFVILDKLVDMGEYGANDDKSLYADWAWKQATDGNKVYAIPVDGGPMALMYRKDLFAKYKIAVPKTWDEYAAAAEKIKAADPKAYIASFGKDGGWLNGLMWQAGCKPYSYSQAQAKDAVGIRLTSPECTKVVDFYGDLVDKGLMAKDPFFTADASAALDSGKYWTWAAAGWTPGYLAGSLKKTSGKWGVAPMPQWTEGANDQGDWGGSTFTVTTQSQHPREATIVARELFGSSKAAWDIGLNKAFLYPLVKDVAANATFTDKAYDFFGGQKVNQIFVPVSNSLGEFQYTPFQDYVFATMNDLSAEALAGKRPWSTVLDETQKKVVAYAQQQGFKVSE
ncbi:ABC transporter substrate-binding protein [Terrabacter sp. GCM10028922]|uniref:ABC transporter substrate-binding protein n=1 Tax=Terrabacter sp. GCM10028922 TaxID=3273428 RepID=UPI003614F93A